MKQEQNCLITPYLEFSHEYLLTLRNSIPLELRIDKKLLELNDLNNEISIDEINKIYFPISRLLNFYITSNLRRQIALQQFLGINSTKVPYIIGIAGSVAVGKSTTARLLQTLLNQWPEYRKVDLITTDCFLYPNQILNERGIMKKKGFPQSYDMHRLVKFLSDIKSGVKQVTAPVYSHITYDIIPDKKQLIRQPDILILEGLNVLQSGIDDLHTSPYRVFVSDFIDFSIYVDAPENLLKKWYISRFLKYSKLEQLKAINTAKIIWEEVNKINLEENIIPTKKRASLIITKGSNHSITNVRLRR